MKNLWVLLSALAFSVSAWATDPKPVVAAPAAPVIVGEKSAAYLLDLKVKNVPTGTAIIWDVFPEEKAVTRIVKTEQACLIAGPAGTYRVKVRLVKGEDVTELRGEFTLTGNNTGHDPPVTNPPVTPIPVAGYYFVIVRPDGPADPKFTKAMNLPGWAELQKKGHSLRDYTVSAAEKELNITLPFGTQLPAVVTLVVDKNATPKSRVVRGPIAMPTDDESIARLPEVK